MEKEILEGVSQRAHGLLREVMSCIQVVWSLMKRQKPLKCLPEEVHMAVMDNPKLSKPTLAQDSER